VNKRRTDISLIDKYLKGELDEKAMHQLERRAQDDPFLMDAMEGYEKIGRNQEKEINELYDRLNERVSQKKNQIVTLKSMSIAASVLVVLSAGGLLLYNNYHPENSPKQAVIVKSSQKPIVTQKALTNTDKKIADNIAQPSVSKARSQEQFTDNKRPILSRPPGNADIAIASAGKDTALKDTTPLDEVVVVGYTAQKKKDVTGAVAAVPAQYMKADSARSTSKLLQGKAAGVTVTSAAAPASRIQLKSSIKCRVVDKTDGSPIPGATVKLAGTNISTVTDANGEFTLNADKNKTNLVVSFIGYQTLKINAANPDSTRTIELVPSGSALAEVVVTDYTSRNKDAGDGTPVGAHPKDSWKSFNEYLKENAVSPDGKTGVVKLSFEVEHDGTIEDIKVVKGLSQPTDQKAIDLIKAGSAWIGNSSGAPETITIRVKFAK
jgi:TonB family protein